MNSKKSMRRYMKYFDDLLEDLPVSKLPKQLQSCGDCNEPHRSCHMLVAGRRGRKIGIEAVCIIRCSECQALHLTQMFTPDHSGSGMDAPILESIARDLGMVFPPKSRVVSMLQPDA